MQAMSVTWRFVTLLVCLALLANCARADVIATPLCAEVHGFAGEVNDHLKIPITQTPATGEAIVVVARTFPMNLGMVLQPWLQLNVTYHLASVGALVSRLSSTDGILQLFDVAVGSEIEVRVQRTRIDGPVPFTFYSYHANRPTCFLKVDMHNTFHSPIPLTVQGGGAATMYFETTLPAKANAVTVYATANFEHAQPIIVLSPDLQEKTEYAPGALIRGTMGGTVLFSYTPATQFVQSGHPYLFLIVTVQPGEWDGTAEATPSVRPHEGDNDGPTSPAPTSVPSRPPKPNSSSGFGNFLVLLVLLMVGGMVAVSYYNYTRLGKTEFPEMIPGAEYMQAASRCCTIVLGRLCGRPEHLYQEGYDDVTDTSRRAYT